VRAEPVDLTAAIDALLDAAPGLPHPALEAAARRHARFLADLADRRDLLRREVLVVLRQALQSNRAGDDPAGRLHRRASEAAMALAAAGVTLTILDGAAAAACLARALDPAGTTRIAGTGRAGRDRRAGHPLPAAELTPGPERTPMTRLFSRIARPAGRPASPFGPDAIEVGARNLRVGDGWCRSFAIVGYPREVGHGWLEPLTAQPSRLDVAVHVEPVPADVAADRLRRQLARLESGRRADAAKGRLGDPDVEVAASDARELAAGLARGEQKLFRVGLYLTVHAASEKALDAECARVRAVCASMLLDAQPATWRTLQGWTSTCRSGSTRSASAAASTPTHSPRRSRSRRPS